MTIDEARLIARAFSTLPIEVIVRENIPIFDRKTVYRHEQRLQEEADKSADGRKLPFNRGEQFKTEILDVNLMSLMTSLSNLMSNYRDAQVTYFALYSLFNIVYTVNLLAPTVNGQSAISENLTGKGPVDISKLTLNDLDYQMLTTCLLESRALSLTLLQPTLPEADADILRVCTKLIITLCFKAASKRILVGSTGD